MKISVGVAAVFLILIPALAYARDPRYYPDPEEYAKWPGENQIVEVKDGYVVPNLVGENSDKPEEKIHSRLNGFKFKVNSRVKNSKPRGIILSQEPKANTVVKTKQVIKVVISDGQ